MADVVKKALRLLPLLLLILPVLSLPAALWPISYAIKHWRRRRREDIGFDDDDILWYSESAYNRPIIDSLILLSNRMNIDDLRHHMGSVLKGKLNTYPGFIKFLCKEIESNGSLYWRRIGHLNIHDYIVEHPTVLGNIDDCRDAVDCYISQKLLPGTSPWRIILIHVRDGRSVLLCRVKHSIADGLGLLRFLLEHAVDKPDSTHKKSHWESLSTLQRISSVISNVAKDGIALINSISPGAQCEHNSLYGAKLTGRKRIYWTNPVAVRKFENVKRSRHVTMNDIAVTAICHGLSKYAVHMELPPLSNEMGFYQLGSVRSNDETLQLKNIFGHFITYADLSGEKSLEEMLSDVHNECSQKKVHQPLVTYYMKKFLSMILPLRHTEKLLSDSSLTFSISNLVGAKSQVQLHGIPVENMIFFPPNIGISGVMFSVHGYNGNVTIGTKTDTAVIADPKLLIELIEASLNSVSNL